MCVFFSDPKLALEFLEKMKDKVKASEEAKVLCMTLMGIIHLRSREFPPVKVKFGFNYPVFPSN